MAFDKIQTQAIDVDTAPVKGSVNNSDYVLIRDVTTGDLQRILVSDLLAGSAGSIRLFGEADMENAATTPTSIVVNGDPNNAVIVAGQAPTGTSPNGISYIVKAPSGPVQTQISGTTETVNDNDEIVWTGTKWSILAFGSDVTSVNGRTGDVTGLAEANEVYSKSESDAKYLPIDGTSEDSKLLNGHNDYYSPRNNPNWNQLLGKPTEFPTSWGNVSNKPNVAIKGESYTKAEADNLLDDKLNKSGGKLTGALEAATGGSYYTKFSSASNAIGVYAYKNTSNTRAGGSGVLSRDGGETVDSFMGWGESPWLEANSLTVAEDKIKYKGFRVYHEGDKPTAADVGALPDTTALFSGNYADLQGIPTYFDTTWSRIDGKPSTFPPSAHNHNTLYYTKTEIDGKGYLTKAVADTEYAPINHNHDSLYYRKSEVDTKLNVKFDKSGGTIGNTVISSSKADAKLILQRTDLDHHIEMAFLGQSGNITYFGTTQDGKLAYGDSTNLSASGAKIYSTANKPTAADVGALTQSQGDARYLQKSGLGTLNLSTSGNSEINMNAGTNKNVTLRMWEAAQTHGAYVQYRGATDNALVFGTYNDKNPTQYMYVRRGSPDVNVNGKISIEGHIIELGNKVRLSSNSSKLFAITATDNNKTGYFGPRNASWFHMETDAPSGFYSYNDFNVANLYSRGRMSSGSFSGGNHAVRIANDFYDSTWGRNGTAAYSVNKGDSSGAHWAFASYYDGTNIRSGIQILTDSTGRMRFYTNRRSNYVEVHSGQVFAGSGQSSASNAYTRKDYVDSKIAALPKAVTSEVMVGNDITDRTTGVRQGNVTWYARDWNNKTTQSDSFMTWVNPATGFKVTRAGTYEIEFTDMRRARATGQADTFYGRIQINTSTKMSGKTEGQDNALVPITTKWVGHLNVDDTVRYIVSGGQIAVPGANFTIRFIK